MEYSSNMYTDTPTAADPDTSSPTSLLDQVVGISLIIYNLLNEIASLYSTLGWKDSIIVIYPEICFVYRYIFGAALYHGLDWRDVILEILVKIVRIGYLYCFSFGWRHIVFIIIADMCFTAVVVFIYKKKLGHTF